jgi:hypothetical protein
VISSGIRSYRGGHFSTPRLRRRRSPRAAGRAGDRQATGGARGIGGGFFSTLAALRVHDRGHRTTGVLTRYFPLHRTPPTSGYSPLNDLGVHSRSKVPIWLCNAQLCGRPLVKCVTSTDTGLAAHAHERRNHRLRSSGWRRERRPNAIRLHRTGAQHHAARA